MKLSNWIASYKTHNIVLTHYKQGVSKMTLSIVVPCYNEEKVLRAFYSETSLEIHKLTTDYEFVLLMMVVKMIH